MSLVVSFAALVLLLTPIDSERISSVIERSYDGLTTTKMLLSASSY
jgi:hypothetical protein